jgi:TrmH family RNA methyltransferase
MKKFKGLVGYDQGFYACNPFLAKRNDIMKEKSMLSSTSNPQIKNLALLQKKAKARKEQGVFVIEGVKMFEEAKALNILKKAYASESFYQEILKEEPTYFQGFDYEVVSDSLFKEISDTKTPQGIMGIVQNPTYSLSSMLQAPNPCLLILEDIRDPGNLGTMIRTAEGAGITGIILNQSCVDLFNPKTIRSTMGSIFRVPFYQTENLSDLLKQVKKHGIPIYAAHLSGKDYDTEDTFKNKCAILIGNEANGLTDETASMADVLVRIPMAGKVESLNAAIAAAIFMYEAARQRRKNEKNSK